MVSKFLMISLLSVGAVAAYDMLSRHASPEVGDKLPADSQSLTDPEIRSSADRIQDATHPGALENPLARTSSEAFDVISERTLFNPSRRQPVAAPPPAPTVEEVTKVVELQPAPNPAEFTLLGIVVSNRDKVALLRWNQTNETLRLRPGENFTGWKIAEIGDRSVSIEQRGSRFTLELFTSAGDSVATRAQD